MDKEVKESLTNEKLRTKFTSQFDLVRYAILLAENMIRTGREPHVRTDMDNPAMQILAEIIAGKDRIEDTQRPVSEGEEALVAAKVATHMPEHVAHTGKGERKKSRIIH